MTCALAKKNTFSFLLQRQLRSVKLFLYKYIFIPCLFSDVQFRFDLHIYMKFKCILPFFLTNNPASFISLRSACIFFLLWAIPQPPCCRLRCPSSGVQLSTPRGDTNTWRSSETRMAPESRPACMAPLTLLSRLPVKGSARTTTLTCDGDNNAV